MKKSFIPLTALALFALVSCGNNTTDTTNSSNVEPTTSETSSEDAVNSVTITNKEALTAEWYVGNADRTMNITLDPAGNVNSLINKGTVKIVSSNTNVITVAGKVLTAAGAGKSTITVTYGSKSDSVEIQVKAERTAIDEYGTVHAGTEADPLDNEDAIKVAKATGETATTKYYYVKGTVASFRDAPSSYGNVSYYLTPATANGDKFLVYRATLTNGGKVTDDDIWVGAIVTAKVKIVNYNSSVPETSQGGEITNVEGTKPMIQTIEATVAQALTACKALDANTSSTDKYVITGYITAVTSSGFYMGDTKGKITPTNDDFLVYGWSGTTAAKCTLNAKVKVTATLKYYQSSTNTSSYNYETGVIDSVEILEEGDAPATIESINVATAITKTNALENDATSEAQYDVTGYVISVDDAYSTQYKNISITIADAADATTGLTVFRAKLADGIDNTKVVAGAKVTIRGYLKKYVSGETVTPELVSGTITALTEGTAPVVQTIEATVAEAVTAAKALASGATSVSNYAITGYVTKISGAYSADFGNMSFYMSDTLDDPDATFIAYQVACTSDVAATIVAGAKVKVTGKLTTYNGTPETTGKGAASVELVAAPVGASIEATIASKQVETGKTVQITTTAQDGVTFTYTSSDTTIATVDGTGLVTGVAEGNVTIEIAASTGRKTYIAVEVVAKIYPSTTIESFEAVSGSFGETGYTYTSAKANSSTNPGVYDGVIRLYQNGATFTIAGGETSSALLSIKITSDGTSTGEGPFTYVYGASSSTIGTAVTAGSWSGTHTQTISFDETAGVKYFQLTTTGTTKTARVYIKSLVLTFAA